jgi:hypothetical protein
LEKNELYDVAGDAYGYPDCKGVEKEFGGLDWVVEAVFVPLPYKFIQIKPT